MNDCESASLILLAAIILDWIYPRHEGLAYLIHPVHLTYWISQSLFNHMRHTRIMGVLIWLISVVPVMIIYITPLLVVGRGWILILVSAIVLKMTFSLRLLIDIARNYLNNEGQDALNYAQQLVRRNVYALDEGHVNSAVIESLAESLVDGFSSPLFYFSIIGVPGALLQRLTNTMDSSLGYMDEPYREPGWFSAKMDTLINYIPARLTAVIILFTAKLLGFPPSIHIFMRNKRSTQSINAGYPIAAISASLGVRLEKIGSYSIGSGKLPSKADVENAIRLITASAIIMVILSIIIQCIISMIIPHI
ncbi:MAG: cobalamin biosynthesis protein [Thermocladium sp.]